MARPMSAVLEGPFLGVVLEEQVAVAGAGEEVVGCRRGEEVLEVYVDVTEWVSVVRISCGRKSNVLPSSHVAWPSIIGPQF